MGRAALDEDAIRLIEQHHPDVDFDWNDILKGPTEVGAATGSGSEREPRRVEGPRKQDTRPRAAGGRSERRPLDLPKEPAPAEPESSPGPLVVSHIAPVPIPEALAVEVDAAEEAVAGAEGQPHAGEPVAASLVRLGAEALQRLRARHAELLARITDQVADPARAEELKAVAERLNPDTWVTEAEVAAGLEEYEAVLGSLQAVVGRRRRRRRRRTGSAKSTASGPASGDADGAPHAEHPATDEPEQDDPEL